MNRGDFQTIHANLLANFNITQVLGGVQLDKSWQKSPGEMVTNLDVEIDSRLQILLGEVLNVPVLSEERAMPEIAPNAYWLVDPLDGTNNYLATLAPTSISIALMVRGFPAVSLICNINNGHISSTFLGAAKITDEQAKPAILSTEPLIGLSTGVIRNALVSRPWSLFLSSVARLGKIRIFGSQALQGLWVGEGKLQMSFSIESRAWDDCAAGLMVVESGGDWLCFTTKGKTEIRPTEQTSSTFLSSRYRGKSPEPVELFIKALETRDDCEYRLITKEM